MDCSIKLHRLNTFNPQVSSNLRGKMEICGKTSKSITIVLTRSDFDSNLTSKSSENTIVSQRQNISEKSTTNIQQRLTRSKLHRLKKSIPHVPSDLRGEKDDKISKSLTITLTRSDFDSNLTESTDELTTIVGAAQSVCHNLRKRIAQDEICPPTKRSRGVVACRGIKVPKLLPASKSEVMEGLVVIAKMRSYAAWPALIKSFRKTCVNVHFFGDDTSGNVPYENVGLFQNNHELIKINLKKNIKGYCKAVQCAEGALNVPSKMSILNL